MNTSAKTLRFILAGSILAAVHAQAITYDWSGTSSDDMSGTPANWGGTEPGALDIARWDAATYTNVPSANANMDIGELLFTANNTNSLTFGPGSSTLTLFGVGGVGLQIDSGSGAVSTLATKFAIAGDQSWINNSLNPFTTGTGTITNTGNVTPFTLTIGGSGNTTLGGVISNGGVTGTLTLVKSDGGTLTLTGNNSFTGGLTIKAGTVATLTSANALGTTGAVTLGDTTGTNAATLLVGSTALTYANAIVLATNATVGTLTIGSNNGNVSFSGGVTGTNNFTISNGSQPMAFSTNAINNSGTVTNAGTGAGTVTVSGGIGSNVTGIVQSSTLSALTISGGFAVNAGGATLTNTSGNALLTVSGAITYNAGLTLNGTGNVQLNNQTNTGTGGLTLSSGKLLVGTNNTTNLIAGAAGSVLTLSGGTVTSSQIGSGSAGSRVFGNDLLVNGTVQIGDGASSGLNYTFSGTNQTFNGAVLSSRDNDGVSFTTNPAVLTGNLTVNSPGAGTTPTFTFSGGFTVSGAASANRTVTLSNGATGVTLSGALAGTAAGQTITLAGSGTNNTIGLITGTGGNTPGLIVNGSPTGVFIFSGASTFGGGVTLSGGIAELRVDTTGAITNGPFGTGTLTMNGGSIRPGSGGDRTILNSLNITGGNSTFASSTSSGRALTFTGGVTISGTPTLTFSNTANASGNIFSTSTTTLNSDATFTGAGNYRFTGGLTFSANRQLTLNTTGTAIFRGPLAGGSNTLTLAGNGSNITFGDGTAPLTGTTGGVIVNGPTVSFVTSATPFTTASNFTGGVTATSGIVRIGGDSTVTAGAVEKGPFGVGTFTANGGTITANSGLARTIHNNLAITGDSTFGVIGDGTNTGTLTFNPSTVTLPSPGTITLTGARTLTFNVATTFTGAVLGNSSPSLAVKGIATLTLTNNSGTASTFGNVAIGDAVSSGSLGGSVTINSSSVTNQQNSMGTGAYTVNYGGLLTTTTTSVAYTNNITVNNGGTLSLRAAPTTPGGLTTLNSGAGIGSINSNTNYTVGSTLAVPTSGVLFYTGSNNVALSNAYTTPTGTLAFGGVAGGTFSTGAATTISSATTLAFNQTGGGAFAFNGTLLNANLNIAGGSILSLTGTVPINLNTLAANLSNLGAITTDGGTRSITVNMTPTGSVGIGYGSVSGSYTGGTTVNSGYLNFVAFNNNSPAAAKLAGGASSAGITLNGGWVRISGNNGSGASSDLIFVGPNRGGLEGHATNSTGTGTQTATFSGAIAKSGAGGALTLRYGGNLLQGTSGLSVVLSGDNRAFDTGYTLATTTGVGRVQFTGVNSLGSDGTGTGINTGTKNVITAPGGVAFGFDAAGNGASTANLKTAMSYFSTSTGSILALDNITGLNINLSGSGTDFLDKDIRLGSNGSVTYTGTITPFGSTYNFTPTSLGTLTLGTANQLTSANNLDVAAGLNAPGAFGVTSGTLAITAAQNYSGTTSVAGTVRNSLSGGGTQGTTLQVGTAGNLSGTSGITMDKAASLQLTGTAASPGTIGSAGINITVKGGASLQDGNTVADTNDGVTNRIASTNTLTLGGTSGGGTFTMALASAATHSQSLASLTTGAGNNVLNSVNTAGATNIGNLIFTGTAAGAGYVHGVGGTVTVTAATGFAPQFTNAPTAAGGSSVSTGADGDPILVGAFLGTDFIRAQAGVFAAPGYTTQNNLANFGTAGNGGNILVAGAVSNSVNTGSINSLKVTSAQNIAITAGNKLTIGSGMILNTAATTISGGAGASLTSGTNELIVNDTNSAGTGLTISTQISQNAGSNVTLTKVGAGDLILTTNTLGNAIGDTYINQGTVFLGSALTNIGSGGTITLNSGTLKISSTSLAGAAFSSAYSLVVGPTNGVFQTSANSILSFNGGITLNGRLTVNAANTGGIANINLGGNITGTGTLQVQGPQGAGGTVIGTISGNNSTWTGGILFSTSGGASNTTIVRLDNANAAGTGTIVGVPQTALYFTANMGSANVSNLITGVPVLANWATTSGPVTLSGGLYSATGLNVQGYAATNGSIGVASELVLAGTTAVSNAPLSYNWSTTPTTAIQNFVNGQGGITVGSTNFVGGSLTAIAGISASYILAIDSPVGGGAKLTSGALGFLRFSGAQSFIPGAVGPGYLAALHQANDATNYGNGTVSGSTGGANGLFGFLLTGGSTYTLPEGKSFVIGSIGTSVAAGSGQVGGTLGSTGTGTNTAILVGSPKLAGFGAGDVNVHANAAGSNQTLNLVARNATDTFQIGTVGNPVVFTPTYGDSGFTSSLTLMADRTGTTTLQANGLGTVNLANISYKKVDGSTDASSLFSWNVTAGTLKSPDGASLANSVTLNGGTLQASGAISYANAVTVGANDGTIDTNGNTVTLSGTVGGAGNTLTKTGAGTLNFAPASTLTSLQDLVANNGTTNVNSALGTGGNATVSVTGTTTLKFGSVSQTLSSLSIGAGSTVTFTSGLAAFTGDSGGGKAPSLGGSAVVPEPGTLGLLLVGALGVLNRRRRELPGSK